MTQPRDERFSGMRVQVEGVADLPPDNPPRDERTGGAITITTPEGERITYQRGNGGYWSASQEGMPDRWMLSRVASRAIDEIVRLREISLTPEEADAVLTDWKTPHGIIDAHAYERGFKKLRALQLRKRAEEGK